MAVVDETMLKSKFRGSLVGALIGDCFGARYESCRVVGKKGLQSYFDKYDATYHEGPCAQYTDDTAMTKSIAQSLIEKKGVDPVDLAKKFVEEYMKWPTRSYGGNVVSVFNKLHKTKFADPFGPAREQFGGVGSYGNGAAMRIAPVALFYHRDVKKLIEMTKIVSTITHGHKLGVNGAVLQCLAIQKCLLMDPGKKFDLDKFTNELINDMKEIEKDDSSGGQSLEETYSYQNQLTLMQNLLKRDEEPSDEEVVCTLGNYVHAIYSVPTAVYSFLRALNDIPEIKTNNGFRRTVQYAISLGGDTDTIGSMAGAIAGAYYGYEIISENMQKHCEYINETIESADKLFSVVNE